jgi:L-alanine-DL-glutamate epimerase-like enolase superfamily enzyme
MPDITRRSFLKTAAIAVGTTLVAEKSASAVSPVSLELPLDVTITEITSTRHRVRHPRKIGRNSFRDHGAGHNEPLVRVKTSAGVEGIGNRLNEKALGKTLGDLLEVRGGRLRLRECAQVIISPWSESVLLDIVGKLLNRPAAELVGRIIRREVPCYDGSIYMRDLDHAQEVLIEDTANGLEAGHRAFKIKIGRGNWLKDRRLGYQRDLRAIRVVHKALGNDGHVLVDANNYYSLDESIRLLGDTAKIGLYWAEEMFPEDAPNHDDYRRLRAYVRDNELTTLLADGESGDGTGDLLTLVREGTIQVSQPDIRTLGMFRFLDYAAEIEPFGATIAPHTWAKQLGVLETCLIGMVVPNFTMVEDCRLESEVVRLPHLRMMRSPTRRSARRTPGRSKRIDYDTKSGRVGEWMPVS